MKLLSSLPLLFILNTILKIVNNAGSAAIRSHNIYFTFHVLHINMDITRILFTHNFIVIEKSNSNTWNPYLIFSVLYQCLIAVNESILLSAFKTVQ
jgi:hypothetical protein